MLKLTLRPRERVVVNGCVIRNGDRRQAPCRGILLMQPLEGRERLGLELAGNLNRLESAQRARQRLCVAAALLQRETSNE